MWSSVCSRIFYVIGSDTGTYAQMFPATLGTTSTIGETYLMLGNSTVSGTAKNSKGILRLFGTSSGYTNLVPGNNTTTSINLTLPSNGGTIPVVSLSGTTLTISI